MRIGNSAAVASAISKVRPMERQSNINRWKPPHSRSGANRSVAPSYFTSQITRGDGWTAGLDQRLLQEFHLGLSFGQQKTSYLATASDVSAGRDDKVNSLGVRLSTTILRKGSIAVLYQNSHDTSNVGGYGFSSQQIGFELSYRF